MANVRALAYLPWPVRMVVTLPVLGLMVWANYTAFSNQRAFETFQEAERGGVHHARVQRVAHRAPQAPRHDPDAYYPSEHRDQSSGHLVLWTAVAAGGTGLAVLAGGLGLFSLFGPSKEPEPEPEMSDNPFV